MEVKVECPCGQRYKFDIEPVNGRMPTTVSCPVCALDGTAVAEAIIQQGLASARATGPVRIVAPGASAAPALRIAHEAPQVAPAHPHVESPAAVALVPAPARPATRAFIQAAQPGTGAARVKGRFSYGLGDAPGCRPLARDFLRNGMGVQIVHENLCSRGRVCCRSGGAVFQQR
jgi:hypothetical protein